MKLCSNNEIRIQGRGKYGVQEKEGKHGKANRTGLWEAVPSKKYNPVMKKNIYPYKKMKWKLKHLKEDRQYKQIFKSQCETW